MQQTIEIYKNRPTRAEINLSNLKNNFEIVKKLVGSKVKIMAMVKANAYGHGILEISKELIRNGVDYLGVAYLEEAVFLRKNGVDCPIVVLGAININQIKEFLKYDIEVTSSSIEKSLAISEVATLMGIKATVHLKIDTGMERIGVQWHNGYNFFKKTAGMPGIKIKGVFSHFAKADCDEDFTHLQLKRFNSFIDELKRENLLPELVHMANSAAIINFPESYFNMVRPGIMLYGYNPNGYFPDLEMAESQLKPVMNFKTKVSYFKVCPANTGISYGHTFVTTGQTRIVTLPVGYGDGYNRLLSNKGEVVIRGKYYPVVGNVCMDQLMIDIGINGEAYNGDDVLLFGEMDGKKISLDKICNLIGTISYEALCNISSRVPRIYVYDGNKI